MKLDEAIDVARKHLPPDGHRSWPEQAYAALLAHAESSITYKPMRQEFRTAAMELTEADRIGKIIGEQG